MHSGLSKNAASILFLCVSGLLLWQVYARSPVARGVPASETRDAFYIYSDAAMLAAGQNPYQRIEGSDLKKNQKFTFYLPAFISAAAFSIKYLGYGSYQEWIRMWGQISFLIHILIGLVLFVYCTSRWGALSGMLASTFWWFSRWSLALFKSGQIDSVGILFLLLALIAYERRRLMALLALGASLAVKQMAAFLVPLFICWPKARELTRVSNCTAALKELLIIATIPAIFSLPFLIWDADSFFKMLLFPMTREPVGARSAEFFIGSHTLIGKLPFYFLILGSYFLLIRRKVGIFSSALLILIIFLAFNPVFFTRYFCWALPIIPVAVFENLSKIRGKIGENAKDLSES